jgi:hypothetical protein
MADAIRDYYHSSLDAAIADFSRTHALLTGATNITRQHAHLIKSYAFLGGAFRHVAASMDSLMHNPFASEEMFGEVRRVVNEQIIDAGKTPEDFEKWADNIDSAASKLERELKGSGILSLFYRALFGILVNPFRKKAVDNIRDFALVLNSLQDDDSQRRVSKDQLLSELDV